MLKSRAEMSAEMPYVGWVTFTWQVAVWLPSAVLIVMVASPAATAATLPLVSTVATVVLLLSQVTFLFVALSGFTVAVKVTLSPVNRDSSALSRVTSVTETNVMARVNSLLALPLALVAVTVKV